MLYAAEIYVIDDKIISEPLLKFKTFNAKKIASLPFDTPIEYLVPQ